MESRTTWVLKGKWHQVSAEGATQTLCLQTVADYPRFTVSQVLSDVAATKTTVCGTCERRAEARTAAASGQPPALGSPDRLERLTPEQLAIYLKRQAEQKRRAALRAGEAEAKGSRAGSTSIRAVSGGLPTLGKRRK